MKLSDRLQLIANLINEGETMADIGTDHGFLPIYLLSQGKCPKAIMCDISKGSLKKAEDNFKNYTNNYSKALNGEFRLGDGIDVLDKGEVDVVVMAGIGGLLITEMLEWDMEKSKSFNKYILQPRNNPGRLRHMLYSKGFDILEERLVRESHFVWEVMSVTLGEEKTPLPYGPEFDFPYSLVEQKNDLTKEYLENNLRLYENIYNQICESSKNPVEKGKESKDRIDRIKFLLDEMGVDL